MEAARAWLDVPFHHQGRSRVQGIDCVGLAIVVARDLELIDAEVESTLPHTYERIPDPKLMASLLHQHMDATGSPAAGDWIWLAAPNTRPRHIGMLTSDDTWIHAYEDVGRVLEQPLRAAYRRMIKGAWSYRGVSDG